jgi:hypothetical protein
MNRHSCDVLVQLKYSYLHLILFHQKSPIFIKTWTFFHGRNGLKFIKSKWLPYHNSACHFVRMASYHLSHACSSACYFYEWLYVVLKTFPWDFIVWFPILLKSKERGLNTVSTFLLFILFFLRTLIGFSILNMELIFENSPFIWFSEIIHVTTLEIFLHPF